MCDKDWNGLEPDFGLFRGKSLKSMYFMMRDCTLRSGGLVLTQRGSVYC